MQNPQNQSLVSPEVSSAKLPSEVQQHSLIEASTQLIAGVVDSNGLLGMFQGKAEKQRKAKLKAAVLEQSARVVETQLAKTQELLELNTATREQAYIDQLRIDYRHTEGELARQAENDLRVEIISLYGSKVNILESLAKIDADAELKQIAAQVVARLTEASAEQLVRHNTKPR